MKGQQGFGLIEVALILLLVGIGAGVVYTYNTSITRAERAEAENKGLREANSEYAAENQNLRQQQARRDVVLAERRGQQNAAKDLERRINAKLDQALQQPETRAWGNTPVPSNIVDSLRINTDQPAAKDGGGKPIPGSTGGRQSP